MPRNRYILFFICIKCNIYINIIALNISIGSYLSSEDKKYNYIEKGIDNKVGS